MRTDQIIYLNEIHRATSLHKASETLHISPQALSLSIRALEEECGFMILDRNHTGVTLTEEGLQLLVSGNRFLSDLRNLQNKHKEFAHPRLSGTLEVLATNGVIETFFPSFISQLFKDYPTFHLKLVAKEFNEIPEILSHSDSKLSFIYRLFINDKLLTPFDENIFSFKPLLSGSYYCTIPKSFSISRYKTISLKTMLKYPIILFTPTSDVILQLFSDISSPTSSPEIIFADNFTIYKQLLTIGAGLGMTLVLNDTQTPILSLPNLKSIPFKENIKSDLGCLYGTSPPLSPIATTFLDYLVQYVKDSPREMIPDNEE